MAVADIAVIPGGVRDVDVYDAVDRAIDIIKESGLTYEVDAMSTAVEGDINSICKLIKKIHRELFSYGATSVVSTVRIHESKVQPTTIDAKTKKHRQK